MFAQVIRTLKFIFSRSDGKLFSVLFQAIIYVFLGLRKCKNDCKILKIILVPDLCALKPEIARLSIGFQSPCHSFPCSGGACRPLYNENDYTCICNHERSGKHCHHVDRIDFVNCAFILSLKTNIFSRRNCK